jgi:hypothetical protein
MRQRQRDAGVTRPQGFMGIADEETPDVDDIAVQRHSDGFPIAPAPFSSDQNANSSANAATTVRPRIVL